MSTVNIIIHIIHNGISAKNNEVVSQDFFHLLNLCLPIADSLCKMRNKEPLLFPLFRLEVIRSLLKLESSEKYACNNETSIRSVGGLFPSMLQVEGIIYVLYPRLQFEYYTCAPLNNNITHQRP